AGVDGRVTEVRVMEGKRKVIITSENGDGEEKVTYNIPINQNLLVNEGDSVLKSDKLTEGNFDPQQLLEVEGIEAVQRALVDEIQEVYRSQGVSISNKHIEVILRKVAPVNRVKINEEGDTSFVAGDLVWTDDIDAETAEIGRENERNIDEAVRIFTGIPLKDVSAQKMNEAVLQHLGKPLDEEAIRTILRPGMLISSAILTDTEGKQFNLVVGEAAFRKQLEGLELIGAFQSADGRGIEAGTRLTLGQLAIVTSNDPTPLLVRDEALLEKLVDTAYIAEDIVADGESVAKADRVFTLEDAALCRERGVKSVMVWHSVERVNLLDILEESLKEKWGKSLTRAIDIEGNAIADLPQLVDERVIKGILEGRIGAVEIEGAVFSRDHFMKELLSARVYGKILLEPVVDARGNVLAEAAQEVNQTVIERLSGSAGPTDASGNGIKELVVRPMGGHKKEEKKIIQRVTFVRKLREGPKVKPFVHGITKAALATDSFLSA
ncbi:MAG TPA: DNA-directed RNA polymerase subunit beta', partial [Synergistales bacterium]|nr:DNA-directed RNA polymerase subunit beta' [Synergistales bacterium]